MTTATAPAPLSFWQNLESEAKAWISNGYENNIKPLVAKEEAAFKSRYGGIKISETPDPYPVLPRGNTGTSPRPTRQRIERAASVAGPWAASHRSSLFGYIRLSSDFSIKLNRCRLSLSGLVRLKFGQPEILMIILKVP
jgi:hypothetical protein